MKTMSSLTPALLIAALAALAPAAGVRAQQAGPWKPLFDGKNLDAWRIYKSDAAPKLCDQPTAKDCWQIVDGVLQKDGNANDMITKDEFGDFELQLEWKMGKAGNSGVFYRGTEEYNAIYWSAPEYQLLDNIDAADNKKTNHLAGSVYDLYDAPADAVKPIGQWNQTRIVARGKHVEHWLNGRKTAEYEIGSPDWDAKLQASKFKDWSHFAQAKRGHFGVQGNHPGMLALRNIRVRELR